MPIKPSLTKQLLIDIEQLPITKQDFLRAGQHVLDWVACSSLGRLSEAGMVYQSLLSVSAGGNCTALGSTNCALQDAAQYNGALGNILEMDDIHRSSIMHPGPVVIPAALAVAEQFDCSIEAFLMAVIKGYEFAMRLGTAIGRSHYRYFHNTSTCGVFGSAMAAASLLELNQQQTLWALGNAGSKASGLWQMRNESVLTKQWHNAETCRAGVMAALLAKQGLSGPEYILEGPQGIFSAMSTDANSEAFIQKHDQWLMYDCSFKPWPACRHAHPAMDGLLTLLKEHQTSLDGIQSIEVRVYKDAKLFCDNPNPRTELQAKFSIQHALSAILLWGEPKLEHYLANAFENDLCKTLRQIIVVKECDEIESHYPHHFGAKCAIKHKSGESITLLHKDTLGDPERPLSQQQLIDKADMLLSKAGVSKSVISKLCQFNWLQKSQISTLSSLLTLHEDR